MQDVSGGKERVRIWPRKRPGAKKTSNKEKTDKFAAVQMSTKYVAPNVYRYAIETVRNSPLLPRDALTMGGYNRWLAFILESGRILWPMPAVTDVSQSLDVLGQTEGATLKRAQDRWVAVAAGNGQGLGYVTLLDETITSPVAHLDVINLEAWSDLIVLILGLGASASGIRSVLLSTDNGATFFDSSGDYKIVTESGALNDSAGIPLHTAAVSGGRSGSAFITKGLAGWPPMIASAQYSNFRIFNASPDPVNALRVVNNVGGTLNNGRVLVLGR